MAITSVTDVQLVGAISDRELRNVKNFCSALDKQILIIMVSFVKRIKSII